MNKSMVDIAYKVLSKMKNGVKFDKLWIKVCHNYGEETIDDKRKYIQLYNNIMLDNRFVLVDNKWDLRERRRYDEVHIDTSAIILEDDDKEVEIDIVEPIFINEDEDY